MSGPSLRPGLALVTPSFNQGPYLEQALSSVLDQAEDGLEYVVVDGGSTDGSLEILRRFGPRLTDWSSRPDRGMYDALNQGFERTTAEIMGWLNADDFYLAGSLAVVREVFDRFPEVEWLASARPAACNRHGQRHRVRRLPGFHEQAFWHGEYVVGVAPYWSGWIPQESTFWRRSLWRRAGGALDDRLDHAGDFDLWARFYGHTELVGLDHSLGVFRRQPEQKTAVHLTGYIAEARSVLESHGGTTHGPTRALTRKWITRLPAGLRRPFQAIGLAHSAPVITRRGGTWRLVHRSA